MRPAFENFVLKIASLALAVLLWYVIAGEKTSERGLSVPVELQNFPSDLELTGDPVNTVEVRLRASPGVIQNLGPGDVSAVIDLAGVQEGERRVHLKAESIRVPFGVRVVKVNPSILTLHFERTVQKVVPVRPRVIGHPARGFEVAEIVADPSQVRISGPRGRVEEVESAVTEPISIDGARAPVTDTVNLGLEDPLLRIDERSPEVRVTANVRETQASKVMVVPVAVQGGAAVASPPEVRVTLTGATSMLARASAREVRLFVEATGSSEPLPVRVELASELVGVTVERLDPPEVRLRPATRRKEE
jgi:YbbR domain-containing protein